MGVSALVAVCDPGGGMILVGGLLVRPYVLSLSYFVSGVFVGSVFLLVLGYWDFFFSDSSYFLPFHLYQWSWLNKTGATKCLRSPGAQFEL